MQHRSPGAFFFGTIIVVIALVALGVAIAGPPSPGSKEDPLVTKTYVDWHAVWREMKVESGDFLKLEPGVELVLLEPVDHPLHLREANLEDTTIVDLTSAETVTAPELIPRHHYLVASTQEARITVDADATIFVRGLKP